MKAIFLMDNAKVLEEEFLQKVMSIKECLQLIKWKEKECTIFQTVGFMKVIFFKVKNKAKVNIFGQMDKFMMEILKMINAQEQVFCIILMEKGLKEHGKMDKRVAKVHIFFQMDLHTA